VVKSGEIIAAVLLTWHNLTFYQNLMLELRQTIAQLRLERFAAGLSSSMENETPA
jgi:queuine tRNA-ribosyltransferase